MRTTFDAVIVGAGPAGATAAILLARTGWAVALVEQQVFPRRKVCGECIAASNGALLEELGVGDVCEAAGGPALRRVALMHAGSCALADLPPARHARFRWGRAVAREVLDTQLRDRAQAEGVVVLQPWRVDACERHGELWRCRLSAVARAGTAMLDAPVLVDAHGSWSPLHGAGDSAATTRRRRASDLFAFKANYAATSLAPGVLPVLSFEGGYGGMVIGGDGLATVACCVRRDRLARWRREAPATTAGDSVERALKACNAGVRRTLAGAARQGPWLAVGPLSPGMQVGREDGILRVGNAAGEAHPILGEGISMALQSAALLAARLRATPPAGHALPTWRQDVARDYERAYRQAFTWRYRVAAAFAHAAMSGAGGAALVVLARLCPGLLTAGARWGGKLDNAADFGMAASAADRRPAGAA